MNSFDMMIEKYRRELIDAKRKSILQAIDDVQGSEDSEPVMQTVLQQEEVQEKAVENPPTENEETAQQQQPPQEALPETPQNLTDDADEQGTPEPQKGTGRLRVQVYASDQVYPISAAEVLVYDKNGKEVFRGYSNASGIVSNILLEAPAKVYSDAPSFVRPYAQYDITVKHPRYATRKYIGVPVFPGIESIQTVQLVPSELVSENYEVTVESEPNALLLKESGENAGETNA